MIGKGVCVYIQKTCSLGDVDPSKAIGALNDVGTFGEGLQQGVFQGRSNIMKDLVGGARGVNQRTAVRIHGVYF